MDEIVKLVQDKTGLSDDAARELVNGILELIKAKLPDGLKPMFEGLISGEGSGGGLGAVEGMLGGFFGNK